MAKGMKNPNLTNPMPAAIGKGKKSTASAQQPGRVGKIDGKGSFHAHLTGAMTKGGKGIKCP